MPRKIQTSYTHYPPVLAAMGDSLTENTVYAIRPDLFWPAVAAAGLVRVWRPRDWGISGDTTPGMVERFGVMTSPRPGYAKEVPSVACLWGGTNDAANAIPISTLTCSGTTATLVATRAHGIITGASVTISGATPSGYNGTWTVTVTGTRTFTFTVGSTLATASGASAASPLTGTQTQTNLTQMGSLLKAAGCTKVVLMGQYYLNITSGGDTLSTPYAPYDDVTGLRFYQKAAVTAITALGGITCVYGDLYNTMRNLIVNGTDTQGSASWHVSQTNTHLNVYGNSIAGGVIVAAMQGAGWNV